MLGNAGKAHGHVGGASGGGRDKGKGKEKGGVGLEPELDTGEYEKQLTRREKAKVSGTMSSCKCSFHRKHEGDFGFLNH